MGDSGELGSNVHILHIAFRSSPPSARKLFTRVATMERRQRSNDLPSLAEIHCGAQTGMRRPIGNLTASIWERDRTRFHAYALSAAGEVFRDSRQPRRSTEQGCHR